MSNTALTVCIRESKARLPEFAVLLVLADMADKATLKCHPSRDTLAKWSRVSLRTVVNCVQRLERLGEISVEENAGPHGVNVYTLEIALMALNDNKTYKIPQKSQTLQERLRQMHGAADTVDAAHKPFLTGKDEEERIGFVEWPSLEDVLKASAEYPGNIAKGIPPKIPNEWAQYHFHHRTHEKQSWAANWKAAMVSLFEIQWQNGQLAARGQIQQKQSGKFFSKKSEAERREKRSELYEKIRVAREFGKDTAEFERELKAYE